MNRIVKFIFGLLEKILILAESLLGVRFILRFLNASSGAEVVRLFYSLTDFLIAPFKGIFQNVVIAGGTVDLVVLSAMIAYAFAFLVLRAIFVRK